MKLLAIFVLSVAMLSQSAAARAQSSGKMTPEQAKEENAYTLGVQAYLWGFPLYFYEIANAEG